MVTGSLAFTDTCLNVFKGGGRRGGGGGGGDSEGGSFDFRQWLANLFQGLGKTGRSLGKTVAAILLLLSIFYASNFIKPLMRATINGLRWVLRLDGAGSRRVCLCSICGLCSVY